MANTRPNKNIPTEQENPLFHDTWKLLKNYRDAVWNLELAVQQVRSTFEIVWEQHRGVSGLHLPSRGRYRRLKARGLCKEHRAEQQDADALKLCSGHPAQQAQARRAVLLDPLLQLSLAPAAPEHGRDHREPAPAYSEHLPQNLLPKAPGGGPGA